MLKQSKRIQGRERMSLILSTGKERATRFFFLRELENSLHYSRYALVLSRKLERSAVGRNAKRRQMYEAIRLLEKNEEVPKDFSFDRVVLARTAALHLDFDALYLALKDLLTPIYE